MSRWKFASTKIARPRPAQTPGLKLVILSLARHHPTWTVRATLPGANDELRAWIALHPQVRLDNCSLKGAGSYNVKPHALLRALRAGAPECVWLDTDVIVHGKLNGLLGEPPDTVVVTQDPWEYSGGSSDRARTWGFATGRPMPGPINSALVRVTNEHVDLLEAWRALTERQEYRDSQAKPIHERNGHMLGDQDLLSALLASQDFSHLPVRRLRHGSEILQHHGAGAYGPSQRWKVLTRGLPPLLHAMGTVKPWRMLDRPSPWRNARDYYERVYLELSPYVQVARRYRALLHETASWLDVQTLPGLISMGITLGNPALQGAVQATLHRIAFMLRKRMPQRV